MRERRPGNDRFPHHRIYLFSWGVNESTCKSLVGRGEEERNNDGDLRFLILRAGGRGRAARGGGGEQSGSKRKGSPGTEPWAPRRGGWRCQPLGGVRTGSHWESEEGHFRSQWGRRE